MKYHLILATLLLTVFSCKSKKNIVQHDSAIADTSYVENPKTGELNMIITTKNEDPAGSWILQSIGANSDGELARISMQLQTRTKEKKVSGNDACNQYNGALAVFDTRRIEFGPIASTKRACMIPAKYATPFYNAMRKVKTYTATTEQLIFKDSEGKKLLQFIKKK